MAENDASVNVGLRFADHSQTKTTAAVALRTQQPFCAVDGVEHPCAWGELTRIAVSPGAHKLETFTRFKGIPIKRFKGKTDVTVDASQDLSVVALLGQFKTKYEIT